MQLARKRFSLQPIDLIRIVRNVPASGGLFPGLDEVVRKRKTSATSASTPIIAGTAPIKWPHPTGEVPMSKRNEMEIDALVDGETVLCTISEAQGAALARILSHAGIDCRLVPDADGLIVLINEIDAQMAELLLAKRKKDVEEEEESDDEEEEEEDDDLEEDEDEDEDFDDEEDDEFEEEFDDDELDDDDDDIFYDDDDDV